MSLKYCLPGDQGEAEAFSNSTTSEHLLGGRRKALQADTKEFRPNTLREETQQDLICTFNRVASFITAYSHFL